MGRRVYNHSRDALEVRAETLEALEKAHGILTAPENIARITRGLEKLHRGLTRDRKRFIKSRYLRDREMRLAYATYMTCAQAPKLDAILDSLGPLPKLERPLRILELGCGTGAGVSSLGIAAREHGVQIRHMATDRVPEALEVTEALAATLGLSGVETQQVDLSRGIARQLGDPEPYDLVLAMNVLNELTEDRLRLLARELKRLVTPTGQVLVIEPAAQTPSRHVIQFRDACTDAEWHITAPCPHSTGCPMLLDERDWCHDTWPFQRPSFMEEVDSRVGTRRETLKATWFLFSRQPVSGDVTGIRGRVISEQFREKGRSHAKVCIEDQLITVELQKRDRVEQNAAFADIARYDLIEFSNVAKIGDRHRLTEDSVCSRIDEADRLLSQLSKADS